MAQSEKIFRDLLCESRSHSVESTDPNKARTIDELKRQIRDTKAELEAERAKTRQLLIQHEWDIRRVKDEGDSKLNTSLEALAIRKEQERTVDIRKVEERLRKEWEAELRALEARKTEELSRAQRRWQQERDEEVRRVLREERERRLQDASCESDEAAQKEEKMMRELFQLSQQVSSLEDQVYNLGRENKIQIEQMRRMKHEHELEIADIIRQHKSEASRDYAQLRLAEQILAEREQDMHIIENRAERDRLEKEQLAEEVAVIKSTFNTSIREMSESPQPIKQRSAGGALQKRMEDLEVTLKKLEEDKGNLKQENASLRKKLVQESPGDGKLAGKDEEKMRKLRKRNTDLVTLVKTLDDKLKSLKSEYDQLQKSGPNESEQAVRKALNRQHAKDIMDYTKQIHIKDKEISELKRRISKLEVNSKPPSESVPEMEKKVKLMALDRLKMEKLVAKLCSQLPNEDETPVLSRTELECEVACVEALDLENQTLKRQLTQLQQTKDDVDSPAQGSEVNLENEKLRTEIARLAKFESEVVSLRGTLDSTESLNSDLEQRCHVLSQQLEISQLAVKELQSSNDQMTSMEEEVGRMSREITARRQMEDQLSQEHDRAVQELTLRDSQISTLQDQLDDRDKLLAERELLCQQLQAQVTRPRPSVEVGVQTNLKVPLHKTHSEERVNSEPLLVTSDPSSSPRANVFHSVSVGGVRGVEHVSGVGGDVLDSSLEVEMKAAGIEVADPYDSSEGAGFSDISMQSLETHSLESLKNDKMTTDNVPSSQVGVATAITGHLSRTEAVKVEDIEEEDKDSTFHEEFGSTPVLYIAKFSYNPAEQSPNPTYDMELPLSAGDYVYVFGEMDGDGFFQGRLVSGATGLVPSNFIERVSDGDAPPTHRSVPRRQSNLGDIEEVDEESLSSGSTSQVIELAPPTNVEVERQFVDGAGTSVALRWSPPTPLPTHLTGYNVYMNGVLKASVTGVGQCSVLLSDVPLTKLVRITVKSVSEEGESSENAMPIILNPRYPDPPHNVLVSTLTTPTSLLVHFSPHRHSHTPVTRYTLYLNEHACTHLDTTESTDCQQTLSMLVLPRDVLHLESELNSSPSIELTITACNEDYESAPSAPVGVAKEQLARLWLDEGTVEYSPSQREEDLQLRQTTPMESSNGGHMIQNDDHVTNGVPESVDRQSNKVRYFRALFSYDPQHQSPNKEFAHEELYFEEGDIIISGSNVDVDGFFEGHSRGRSGLVPSNMVEEVLDSEELAHIKNILANTPTIHSNGRPQTPPLDNDPRTMKAIHDYDPSLDSPNENSEVELTFSEGDLIKVYGAPDEDGFYQAELDGKRGLVPKNFLESPTGDDFSLADSKKAKLVLTEETDHVLNLRQSN